jgi:peptidyl-prolyl cis-trans isomerase C
VATSLLEEFGASVSRLDAEAELAANIDDASISMNEAIASLGEPDATEALLVHNAYSQLLIETATDELAAEDSFIEEALERYPTQITNVCVRHILVPDEIELEAVVNRLDAGEDFGAIADQVSLDTNTSGGDLGCSVASRYVEPFAAAVVEAPIGEPVYPIETQFGIHVVLVYERRVPTAEELRTGENDQELPFEVVQSAWADWFTEQVEAADVSVASRIGIWFTDPPSILPPD